MLSITIALNHVVPTILNVAKLPNPAAYNFQRLSMNIMIWTVKATVIEKTRALIIRVSSVNACEYISANNFEL